MSAHYVRVQYHSESFFFFLFSLSFFCIVSFFCFCWLVGFCFFYLVFLVLVVGRGVKCGKWGRGMELGERETWELGKCRGYSRAVYLTLGGVSCSFWFLRE